jgi:uncharacterized protein YciI
MSQPVSVITLTYQQPLDRVDALMEAHVAWLREQYDADRFLGSGRRVPRTGGVILARLDAAAARQLVATDPFAAAGVASYEIVEFEPSMGALRHLLEALPQPRPYDPKAGPGGAPAAPPAPPARPAPAAPPDPAAPRARPAVGRAAAR